MVTVYCYEKCDSLSNITFDDYFNESIVSSPKKEGEGALKLNNLTNATVDSEIIFNAINDAPSGTKVLGFWVRIEERNDLTWIQFKWADDETGHYIWFSVCYDGSGNPIFKGGVSGESSGSYDLCSFSLDTWYWVEMIWTSQTQTINVSGVKQHSWSGYGVSIGENTNFSCNVSQNKNAGIIYIDGIRIASDEEYPPPEDYLDELISGGVTDDDTEGASFYIIFYKETKGCPIPIKKIPAKIKPTVQAEYFTAEYKRIEMVIRATTSVLNDLRDKDKQKKFWKLTVGNVSYKVWMEEFSPQWKRQESSNKPWRIFLKLISVGEV